MTVNPGFGGQSFIIPGMLPKIARARAGRRGPCSARAARDLAGVDGGVKRDNARLAAAGADDGGLVGGVHRRARRSWPTAARSRAYAARGCAGSKACWSRYETSCARSAPSPSISTARWSTARPTSSARSPRCAARAGRLRSRPCAAGSATAPDALIARALEAQGCSGDDALRARLRRWFDAATLAALLAGGTVYPGIAELLVALSRRLPLVASPTNPTPLARAVLMPPGCCPTCRPCTAPTSRRCASPRGPWC